MTLRQMVPPGKFLLAFATAMTAGATPVAGAAAVASAAPVAAAMPAQDEAPPDLARLLEVLGRLTNLYRDSALSFTCVEKMTQTRFRSLDRIDSRKSYTFDYFYVFNSREDVERSGGTLEPGLRDYRTVRTDDPSPEPRRLDPNEMGFAYVERAYSWIFVFSEESRAAFTFTQEADDTALGRDAFVISFEPKLPYRFQINDWYGRVWIDKETLQPLRVVAVTSADFLESFLPSAPERDRPVYAFTHADVEFGEQKNGLRFPSRSMMTGTRLPVPEQDEPAYRKLAHELLDRGIAMSRTFRVEQRYSDYRFFSVRTEAEVLEEIRQQPR